MRQRVLKTFARLASRLVDAAPLSGGVDSKQKKLK
jgi:hypothetical protein